MRNVCLLSIETAQKVRQKMEELKDRRGLSSESELIRQAFALLEATTDKDVELILRDKNTKEETKLLIAS